MNSFFKVSFGEWYRDYYYYELWCENNNLKENINDKKTYDKYIKEYIYPSDKELHNLRNSILYGYYIDDIGDPSYRDGI